MTSNCEHGMVQRLRLQAYAQAYATTSLSLIVLKVYYRSHSVASQSPGVWMRHKEVIKVQACWSLAYYPTKDKRLV